MFTGKDLEIAELIQRRRLQILVHSYLYYELNENLVPDFTFDKWEVELVKLQSEYPEISSKVKYNEAFKNWCGSSGAFLPYNSPEIENIGNKLLAQNRKIPNNESLVCTKPVATCKKSNGRKKLF